MWERKAVFSGKKSLAVALDVGAAALCVKVPVGNDVCVLSLEARCETRAKDSVDGNHIRCTPYQAIVLDFLLVLSSCFVLVLYFHLASFVHNPRQCDADSLAISLCTLNIVETI